MKARVLRVALVAGCVCIALGILATLASVLTQRGLDAALAELAAFELAQTPMRSPDAALMGACADMAAKARTLNNDYLAEHLSRYVVFLQITHRSRRDSGPELDQYLHEHHDAMQRHLDALNASMQAVRDTLEPDPIGSSYARDEVPPPSETFLDDLTTVLQPFLLSVHFAMREGDAQRATSEFLNCFRLLEALRDLGTRDATEKYLALFAQLYHHHQSVFLETNVPLDQISTYINALGRHPSASALATAIVHEARMDQDDSAWGKWLARLPFLAPVRNPERQVEIEFALRIAQATTQPCYAALPQLEIIGRDAGRLSLFRNRARHLTEQWTALTIEKAHVQVLTDLIRLGVAIERHHEEHGAYPESLEAVAKCFDGALPVNPCAGAGYHYRPIVNRYKLFGVVPNKAFWTRRLQSGSFPPIAPPEPLSIMDSSAYTDLDGSVLYPEIPLGEGTMIIAWREGCWWDSYAGYLRPITN